MLVFIASNERPLELVNSSYILQLTMYVCQIDHNDVSSLLIQSDMMKDAMVIE